MALLEKSSAQQTTINATRIARDNMTEQIAAIQSEILQNALYMLGEKLLILQKQKSLFVATGFGH